MDACFVVLGKDNYQREIKSFIKQSKLKDVHEFYMVSLITIGYQARFMVHTKNTPLPLLPATANGRDNILDDNLQYNNEGVCDANEYFRVFEYVPHGECWACKSYLLQFDEQDFVQFGRALVGFYSSFESLKTLQGLVSKIAFRFSGWLSMTAEEKAALVLNRLFFFKSRTVASALVKVDWNPSSLEGNAKELWEQLLGDDYGAKEENDMLARLKVVHDNMRWGTLASALFSGDLPREQHELEKEMADLYGRLLNGLSHKKAFLKKLKRYAKERGGDWAILSSALFDDILIPRERSTLSDETAVLYDKLLESYFLEKLKFIYDAQVMSGNWSVIAWALYGVSPPRTRDTLPTDELKASYDLIRQSFAGNDEAFLEKLKDIYDAQVMGSTLGGNWSVLAWALYGASPPRTRDTLPTDELKASYDLIRQSFAGTEDAFLEKLKDIYDAQVKGGNWSVLASALHNSTPPWSRDSLPTDELIAVYNNLLSSFSGSEEAFLAKLKDIYDAQVMSGTTTFNNRRGCFQWMDDFNELFDSILRSGGDEGGKMVSSEQMKKYEQFSHLLEVLPIVSQVETTVLTSLDITNMTNILASLGDGEEINSHVYTNLQDYIATTNAEEKYKQINDVLSINVDSDGLRKRWYSLFSRFEKVEDVNIEGKMVVLRGMYELTKRKNVLSSSKTDGVKKVASDWGSGSADY